MKMSRVYTMDDDYNDIKIEYETLKKEIYLETALKENKQWLTLSVQGLEWLNGKIDPVGAKLDGWHEQVAMDAENGEYDEVLEDLYDKYYDSFDLPPELQLLKKLGQSAFMFHTNKTLFSKMGINPENIPHQAQKQIFNIIEKSGALDGHKREADRLNSQMPGLPRMMNRRPPSKAPSLSNHSIEAPSISDDLLEELNMNSNLPQTHMNNDSRSQLSISADGKKTLIIN
jgi:hypothetical protein